MEVEVLDNTVLAQSVSDNIKYDMLKDILVKPLEPVMITKEIQVPKVKETAADDETGVDVQEYDEVETKTIEVKSAYRKGIVLKALEGHPFNVGDTVVYNERFAVDFDLVKDSQLVKPYDIVAIGR